MLYEVITKKYKINTAFGTDVLFDPTLAKKNGKQLAKLKRWYTPYEVLKMATHDNAQLLAMSGPRNPYQEGELGVVKEGAYRITSYNVCYTKLLRSDRPCRFHPSS